MLSLAPVAMPVNFPILPTPQTATLAPPVNFPLRTPSSAPVVPPGNTRHRLEPRRAPVAMPVNFPILPTPQTATLAPPANFPLRTPSSAPVVPPGNTRHRLEPRRAQVATPGNTRHRLEPRRAPLARLITMAIGGSAMTRHAITSAANAKKAKNASTPINPRKTIVLQVPTTWHASELKQQAISAMNASQAIRRALVASTSISYIQHYYQDRKVRGVTFNKTEKQNQI